MKRRVIRSNSWFPCARRIMFRACSSHYYLHHLDSGDGEVKEEAVKHRDGDVVERPAATQDYILSFL